MTAYLILVAPPSRPLTESDLSDAQAALEGVGATADTPNWLQAGKAAEVPFDAVNPGRLRSILTFEGLDWAITFLGKRRKAVFVADMDSTMIEIETLDTLATELGLGEAIAEITRRSMNGELDFAAALRERVAMLAGYPAEQAMQTVMDRVTYTPGGKVAVSTMRAYGAYCALVSGGFTFTTETVYAELGFHEHRANVLEVADGTLTGKVAEPIVARDTKLITVRELCVKQGVELEDACTVGDGANDLDMLRATGLGVAYYGKPVVRAEASFRIDHTDLSTLLFYQGYSRDEFIGA
jgi:phosphoserine phosphatase